MFQKKYFYYFIIATIVFFFWFGKKVKADKILNKSNFQIKEKDRPKEYKKMDLPLGVMPHKQKQEIRQKESEDKEEFTVEGEKKNSTKTEPKEDIYESYFSCFGDKIENKICRFKNLFYDTEKDIYFTVFNEKIVSIDPASGTDYFLNSSSIDDHTAFKWDFIEVSSEMYKESFSNKEIKTFTEQTYIFSRFHAGNIMHTIHDDFLPQFATRKQFASDLSDIKNNTIFINDSFNRGNYDELFFAITNNIEYRANWKGKKNKLLLFKNAVVGYSKLTTWYQYGFGKPQGPIPNKIIDGFLIREAADCIKKHYKISSPFDSEIKDIMEGIYKETQINTKTPLISIISRKENRLILNEKKLKEELEKKYDLDVVFVRLEELSIQKVIEIMNRTVIAIGMHGSLLITAMFMPSDAILIELYPFAVPSGNYTPYKHMCNIPGVGLSYRAWENKHKRENISYPERNMHKGGIKHLSKAEQKLIEKTETVPLHHCCTNPYWLFRIYQDTFVNIPEVFSLIKDASKQSLESVYIKKNVMPGVVEKATCNVETKNGVSKILVQWEKPWNVKIQENYEVWSHQSFKAFPTKETTILYNPSQKDVWYDFWIRCVKDGPEQQKGEYTKKISCCVTDKKNVLFKGLSDNEIPTYILLKSIFPLSNKQQEKLEKLEKKVQIK